MASYTRGDRVTHQQYGAGTLTEVNEYHTVIDFDDHGVHKFSTRLVVLEPSAIPAPVRAARAGARSRKAVAKPAPGTGHS
jgi:hypothetical protein